MERVSRIAADQGNFAYEVLRVDPEFTIPDDPKAPIILHARSVLRPESAVELVVHSWRTIKVSCVPIGSHPVEIHVRCARYAEAGRSRRMEQRKRRKAGEKLTEAPERLIPAPLPDIVDGQRMTKRLLKHIQLEGVTNSVEDVARSVGLSTSSVRRIVVPLRRTFIERYRPEAPRRLAIDEVHYGHDKYTVFSDAETGHVIELLPDAQQETVMRALRRLANLDRVEAAACDMFASYLAALAAILPHVPVVADRWHIQKLNIERFNEVRTSVFKEPLAKGDYLRRALRQSSGMLDKPRGKLAPGDRAVLDGMLASEPLLETAYRLHKDFFGLYEIPSRRVAEDYFDKWARRIPAKLDSTFGVLAQTIHKHRAAVFRYWDFRSTGPNGKTTSLTTSPAENANKKIKPFLRQGVVKPEILRRMALLKFGPYSPARIVELCLSPMDVVPFQPEDIKYLKPIASPASELFSQTELPPLPLAAQMLQTHAEPRPTRLEDRQSTQLSIFHLLDQVNDAAE